VRPTYDAVLFDLFGTLVDDAANAFPGARECLRVVEGGPWAIVTSCGADFARRLIAHARLPQPPVLVTADDVIHNKPAPDGYLCAAQRLGVTPQRALVVEDSLQGVAAAREAGMDVVAILRGRVPNFARHATYVIGAIAELRLGQADGAVELYTEK
jgi:beta-phosphoglucomutase-like phosphatase (HAD superfamily)